MALGIWKALKKNQHPIHNRVSTDPDGPINDLLKLKKALTPGKGYETAFFFMEQ
jgi:hypothetical protein